MARNWSEQTEITKRKRVGRCLPCGRAERAIICGYEKDNISGENYTADRHNTWGSNWMSSGQPASQAKWQHSILLQHINLKSCTRAEHLNSEQNANNSFHYGILGLFLVSAFSGEWEKFHIKKSRAAGSRKSGPCHQGMVHTQVADGETASRWEDKRRIY